MKGRKRNRGAKIKESKRGAKEKIILISREKRGAKW